MPLDLAGVAGLVPSMMFGWLAYVFLASLRAGQDAVITKIAKVDQPDLPQRLVRYTHRLTALWCAYFFVASLAVVICKSIWPLLGPALGIGSVVLYVGEYLLRPVLFPNHLFPSLWEQTRNTAKVWRTRRGRVQ